MGAPLGIRLVGVTVHEGADEAADAKALARAQEKALTEHVAAHPEHAGATVKDVIWLVWLIVHRPQIADDEATAEYVEKLRASLKTESASVLLH